MLYESVLSSGIPWLAGGTWHITPFIGEYDATALSDEYKNVVWEKKRICQNCGICSLQLGHVFGREYDRACEKSIVFTNPDARDVECIKRLIEPSRTNGMTCSHSRAGYGSGSASPRKQITPCLAGEVAAHGNISEYWKLRQRKTAISKTLTFMCRWSTCDMPSMAIRLT